MSHLTTDQLCWLVARLQAVIDQQRQMLLWSCEQLERLTLELRQR